MGDRTKIEWTAGADGTPGASWPIVTGCEWASKGCDRCYAAKETAGRLSGHPRYKGLAVRVEGGPARFTGAVRLNHELLDQPLRWRRPRMIFVSSMGDIWHPDVPRAFLVEIFAVMALAPQHTFQVLTKRPQRQRQVLNSDEFWAWVAEACTRRTGQPAPLDVCRRQLANAWLGTSIEDRQWTTRARHLRETDAALRFLSVEPLLMDVAPSLDLRGISWVIVGGESGRDAGVRPMHPQWARNIRDLCEAQGVKFFLKQWGEYGVEGPAEKLVIVADDGTVYRRGDLDWPEGPRRGEAIRAGHDRANLTAMYRVGKKAAGATLDGRIYREMPPALAAPVRS